LQKLRCILSSRTTHSGTFYCPGKEVAGSQDISPSHVYRDCPCQSGTSGYYSIACKFGMHTNCFAECYESTCTWNCISSDMAFDIS